VNEFFGLTEGDGSSNLPGSTPKSLSFNWQGFFFETNPLNQYIITKSKNKFMQTLIFLAIVLTVFYLLFNSKKQKGVTVYEVTEAKPNIIVEDTPFPTPELEKSETKEKQVKPKAVKKPKAKSIKKEIVIKKERKPKDKGNDMLLS
jgi:hypothetical protein